MLAVRVMGPFLWTALVVGDCHDPPDCDRSRVVKRSPVPLVQTLPTRLHGIFFISHYDPRGRSEQDRHYGTRGSPQLLLT